MTSVLVVSDRSLQRLGLRALLDAEPDLTVVEAVAGGFEAVRAHDELRPDIVLVDGRTATADAIRTIRRVTRPSPPAPPEPVRAEGSLRSPAADGRGSRGATGPSTAPAARSGPRPSHPA